MLSWGQSYTGVHAFIQSLPGVVKSSVIHRCTCIYTELTSCCHEVIHTQVYMHLHRAYLMLSRGQSYTGVHTFIQNLPHVVKRSVIRRCTCIYTELTSCCRGQSYTGVHAFIQSLPQVVMRSSHTQVYMHLYRAYPVLSWGQSCTGVHAFIQSLPHVVKRSVIHRCTYIYTELTSCCQEVSHTQVYMHLYRAYLML